MPDDFITPETLSPKTSNSPKAAKVAKPKKKRVVKKKVVVEPKKHHGYSFRTMLIWVLTCGAGMLVIGYTMGITLGVNVGMLGSRTVSQNVPKTPEITIVTTVPEVLPVSLSDEQVACLKKALGEQRYTAIASNLGQATLDEQVQITVCNQ